MQARSELASPSWARQAALRASIASSLRMARGSGNASKASESVESGLGHIVELLLRAALRYCERGRARRRFPGNRTLVCDAVLERRLVTV
jgi:hypothetical protein